jgi:hypothetical protein
MERNQWASPTSPFLSLLPNLPTKPATTLLNNSISVANPMLATLVSSLAPTRNVIHAVFSSFIKGSTTTDGNCHNGADGGPGVSCSVEFSGPYENAYQLEIRNTKDTTWNGTVVDATTGRRVHVGSYTLPAGTQGIKGSQVGFVEYYPWNTGSHTCASLPYTSMVFGVPTSTTGAIGSLGNAYEYGDCVGKVAYKSSRIAAGVEVSVGF